MKLSTLFQNLRTQRTFSAFAKEDIQPMSEVFVSWPKLFAIGWKVGGALVLVSQGFTALQLEILKMQMQQKTDNLSRKVDHLTETVTTIAENMKAMDENMKAMDKKLDENMKAMDNKLTQALPKTR